MTSQDPLQAYLARFRSALPAMTVAEREDILEEIRAHVEERVAESGVSDTEVLNKLGPAEQLAAEYGKGALLRRVRFSFSPWLILRAAFAWAMTGIHGFLVFITALVGYLIGFGFILAGLLKPIFPEETGLWIGPGVFEFGFRPAGVPEAHELLGQWFTQVTLVIGALFFIGTTMLMRRLLPKFKHWRTSALHPGALADAPARAIH